MAVCTPGIPVAAQPKKIEAAEHEEPGCSTCPNWDWELPGAVQVQGFRGRLKKLKINV